MGAYWRLHACLKQGAATSLDSRIITGCGNEGRLGRATPVQNIDFLRYITEGLPWVATGLLFRTIVGYHESSQSPRGAAVSCAGNRGAAEEILT